MGVTSAIEEERDAQVGGSDSTTSTSDQEPVPEVRLPLAERIDPFIQRYETDEYVADTDTVNTMLTGLIAVGNLL